MSRSIISQASVKDNNKGLSGMSIKLIKKLFITFLLAAQMAVVGAAERITYYHNDALGSPVAATDASGNVLWREAYRPYGSRLLKQDGGTNDTWFTGKQEDSATGLSYFHARWYDPTLGRFMAIDPVGFTQGNIHSFNRYAYANNNPYKYIDPDGNSALLLQKGSSLDFQMRNNVSGVGLNVAVSTIEGGLEVASVASGAGAALQAGKQIFKIGLKGVAKKPVRVNLGGEGEVAGAINQQGPWALDKAWRSSRGGKTLQELQQSGNKFVISNNKNLPFKNSTVDEVITNSVPIDKNTFLGPGVQSSEIKRILKPGGRWVNNGQVTNF